MTVSFALLDWTSSLQLRNLSSQFVSTWKLPHFLGGKFFLFLGVLEIFPWKLGWEYMIVFKNLYLRRWKAFCKSPSPSAILSLRLALHPPPPKKEKKTRCIVGDVFITIYNSQIPMLQLWMEAPSIVCTAKETIMKASCTASWSKCTRNWSKDCCTWRKRSCHEFQTNHGELPFFGAVVMSNMFFDFSQCPQNITPLVYEFLL